MMVEEKNVYLEILNIKLDSYFTRTLSLPISAPISMYAYGSIWGYTGRKIFIGKRIWQRNRKMLGLLDY